MSTKLRGFLMLCGFLLGGILFAQQKTVTGTVTDADGFPLPDVEVISTSGESVFTDFDGNYSIDAQDGDILTFRGDGMNDGRITVGASTVYNLALSSSEVVELEGVVVTALGITREKRALGYATQKVDGDVLANQPVTNFADGLSGEVAGLRIDPSGSAGGSTNMIIRGYKSITGDNQALVIVDGTPINNSTFNKSGMTTGRGGFDFGNAAGDINPNDIEKVEVLKGAAATALYGSRGANGVIMITTKTGKNQKGIGAEINSSFFVGSPDKKTLPTYQKEYGAGYGAFYGVDEDGYFEDMYDINGDGIPDLSVPFYEDASFGARFDPNLMVYHWNSLFPQLPTYQKAAPWVAGKHDPNYIWKNTETYINSASFGGSNEDGAFRLSFTNHQHNGTLRNSKLLRNTIDFSGNYKLSHNLTANASMAYTHNMGKGRVGTGYDGDNPMQSHRQWFQMNVDMAEQEAAYNLTGQNISWNTNSALDTSPIYMDNFFFVREHNYESDKRDRYFGNVSLDYKLNDWFGVLGRFAFDNYSEIREERIDVHSVNDRFGPVFEGGYSLLDQNVGEQNWDIIGTINKDFTERLNFDANVGWNLRVNTRRYLSGQTSGGLKVPGLYTLSNSQNPLGSANIAQGNERQMVDGLYARAGFGWDKTYYLEGSFRSDRSSTLPKHNNRYNYFSVSGSIVFSEWIDQPWLGFGKVRANYAEVGNSPGIYSVFDTYVLNSSWGSVGSASNQASLKNPDLKPERTKGWEVGLEMAMFKNRVTLDVSYYDSETIDLLTSIITSGAAGMTGMQANAGNITNKGVEISLGLVPIRTNDFQWRINTNFTKNKSNVVSLNEDSEYFGLASFQGGMQFGAWVGHPLGVLVGSSYVYDDHGNRVVNSAGQYLKEDGKVIGDTNPDWYGGVKNTFTYKNWSLSALIDIQKGGDIFSLDTYYGFATGIYDITAGLNDLGNPIRDPVSQGGGIILPGVNEDGSPNTTRVDFSNYANPYGYARAANEFHVYDASFVKLRNVTLSYTLPDNLIKNTFVRKITLSAIGRNLWIIHKNIPYADPESGLSAGNLRGYQSGAHPTFREIGGSIKIEF